MQCMPASKLSTLACQQLVTHAVPFLKDSQRQTRMSAASNACSGAATRTDDPYILEYLESRYIQSGTKVRYFSSYKLDFVFFFRTWHTLSRLDMCESSRPASDALTLDAPRQPVCSTCSSSGSSCGALSDAADAATLLLARPRRKLSEMSA